MAGTPPPVDRRTLRVELDSRAREWLGRQPQSKAVAILLDQTRCCTGVRLLDISIKLRRPASGTNLVAAGDVEGRPLFVDHYLIPKLPDPVPLTARGLGPFRGLTLDVTGEEWACLLYD